MNQTAASFTVLLRTALAGGVGTALSECAC